MGEGTPDEVGADDRQVDRHERADHLAVETRQDIGSGKASQNAEGHEAPEELPVDVAVVHMRRAGGRCREEFGRVHGSGRGGW